MSYPYKGYENTQNEAMKWSNQSMMSAYSSMAYGAHYQNYMMQGYGASGTEEEPPPPGVEVEPGPPGIEEQQAAISNENGEEISETQNPNDNDVNVTESGEISDKAQIAKPKLSRMAIAKKRLAAFSAQSALNKSANTEVDDNSNSSKKSVMKLNVLNGERFKENEESQSAVMQASEEVFANVSQIPMMTEFPNNSTRDSHSSSISKPKFSLVRFTKADSPSPVITEKVGDYGTLIEEKNLEDADDKQKVVVEWKKISEKTSRYLRKKGESVDRLENSGDDSISSKDRNSKSRRGRSPERSFRDYKDGRSSRNYNDYGQKSGSPRYGWKNYGYRGRRYGQYNNRRHQRSSFSPDHSRRRNNWYRDRRSRRNSSSDRSRSPSYRRRSRSPSYHRRSGSEDRRDRSRSQSTKLKEVEYEITSEHMVVYGKYRRKIEWPLKFIRYTTTKPSMAYSCNMKYDLKPSLDSPSTHSVLKSNFLKDVSSSGDQTVLIPLSVEPAKNVTKSDSTSASSNEALKTSFESIKNSNESSSSSVPFKHAFKPIDVESAFIASAPMKSSNESSSTSNVPKNVSRPVDMKQIKELIESCLTFAASKEVSKRETLESKKDSNGSSSASVVSEKVLRPVNMESIKELIESCLTYAASKEVSEQVIVNSDESNLAVSEEYSRPVDIEAIKELIESCLTVAASEEVTEPAVVELRKNSNESSSASDVSKEVLTPANMEALKEMIESCLTPAAAKISKFISVGKLVNVIMSSLESIASEEISQPVVSNPVDNLIESSTQCLDPLVNPVSSSSMQPESEQNESVNYLECENIALVSNLANGNQTDKKNYISLAEREHNTTTFEDPKLTSTFTDEDCTSIEKSDHNVKVDCDVAENEIDNLSMYSFNSGIQESSKYKQKNDASFFEVGDNDANIETIQADYKDQDSSEKDKSHVVKSDAVECDKNSVELSREMLVNYADMENEHNNVSSHSEMKHSPSLGKSDKTDRSKDSYYKDTKEEKFDDSFNDGSRHKSSKSKKKKQKKKSKKKHKKDRGKKRKKSHSRDEDSYSSSRKKSKTEKEVDVKHGTSSRTINESRVEESVVKTPIRKAIQFTKHVINVDDSGQMGVIESFTSAVIKEAKLSNKQLVASLDKKPAEIIEAKNLPSKNNDDKPKFVPIKSNETHKLKNVTESLRKMESDVAFDAPDVIPTRHSLKPLPHSEVLSKSTEVTLGSQSSNVEDMDVASSDEDPQESNFSKIPSNNVDSLEQISVESINKTAKQLLEKVQQKQPLKAEIVPKFDTGAGSKMNTQLIREKIETAATANTSTHIPAYDHSALHEESGQLSLRESSEDMDIANSDGEPQDVFVAPEQELVNDVKWTAKQLLDKVKQKRSGKDENGNSSLNLKIKNPPSGYFGPRIPPALEKKPVLPIIGKLPSAKQNKQVKESDENTTNIGKTDDVDNDASSNPQSVSLTADANATAQNVYNLAATIPFSYNAQSMGWTRNQHGQWIQTPWQSSTLTEAEIKSEDIPPPPPPGVESENSVAKVDERLLEFDESEKVKEHGILVQYTRQKNVSDALGIEQNKKTVKFSDGILPGSKEAEEQTLQAEIRAISPAPPLPEGVLGTDALENLEEAGSDSEDLPPPPPPASSPPPPPPPTSPPPPPPPITSAPVPQTQEFAYANQYAQPMYYQQTPYGYAFAPGAQTYNYAYPQQYAYQQGTQPQPMYYPVILPQQYQPPPPPSS